MSVACPLRGTLLLALFVANTAACRPASPQAAPPPQTTHTLPSGSSASQGSDSLDIETLRHLEADYLRAEMEDNATIAQAILADDYVGLRSDGSTTSKTQVLNNLMAGAQHKQALRITAINMREHLFGDVACVTYTKIYARGNGGAFQENILHLFTRRKGAWHLQMSTPTPLPH